MPDKNGPQEYSIQQLAEKVGISVRTIRFYTNEGLLPPPPTRGKYSVYSEEYIDRLELIRRLKESFLPLKEIRERVTGLTWEEVKQAIAQPAPQPPRVNASENRENALNYISGVLHHEVQPLRTSPLPFQPQSAQTETWERLELAPGIELHIRSDIGLAERRLAHQMIDYAKKLFNTTR